MKITEIPQDASLFLRIHKGTQQADVKVEIFKIMEKGIVLKPIIVDGKILNLEKEELRLELIYDRDDSKPLIWRTLSYAFLKRGEYSYTILADKNDGIEFNRRNTFRLDMDVQGTLNRNEIVIVHDISRTGISFYIAKDKKKMIGAPITITFQGGYEDITVTGTIVREQELEERVMYGCQIKSSLQVDKFLSEEQVRRLRRRRGR